MIEVQIGLHEESSVELEIFTPQLLALRIMGQSERARTSLLTREQAVCLRAALDELIAELIPTAPAEPDAAGAARLRAA
ncbi:MAG TPA: hypothetical protein VF240_14995 [Pyrinomonadaceae bacterium]